ncbi:MAG: multiprotein bridging factor aMBF1 [Thermoplasmata archaeon]
MLCELCGGEVPRTRRVIVEGTALDVCSKCSKFGVAPQKSEDRKAPPIASRLERSRRRFRPRDVYEKDVDVLVSDYSSRIRDARTKMGLSQEEFGKKLNEKWSVINKLETGELRPDDKLVAKLEKTLGIKLREKFTPQKVEKKESRQALTIGDLIREEKE